MHMTNNVSAEISGKMRQFKRILLSYADFKHAKLAASVILSDHLHDKYPQESYVLLEALNCSMIMAYCRPFSGNDPSIPDLPARLLQSLNDSEREIHDAVLYDRNKLLAHSDADALAIEPVIWNIADHAMVLPLARWGLAPLTEEATIIFHSAAEKLFIATMEERRRLEPEMIPYLRIADPENPFT